MSATEHDRFQDDVGAYLLDALDDGERTSFERHAATCHVCQDELERLRTAADALPRSVEQYAPPPSLKRTLMEQVYAEAPKEARARRRWWQLRLTLPRVAVAATAALLIGLAVGYGLQSGGDDQRTITASIDGTRVGAAHAELVVDGDASQLRVSSMPQPRAGQVYEIWLKRGDKVEPASLFSVDANGNGAGAVPGNLDGVDAVMVTRERAGGAHQPTEAPVVVAKT
jgi:anti-sigma-K factor RskA